MNYKIREVDGYDEAEELKALHDACFGDEAPQCQPEIGWWWLAWSGKEAVGFASLKQSDRYANVGYLYRVGVLPWHRGHGLQRRFIRAREAKARRLGYVALVTDTTDNPVSANSLIKAGYHIHSPKFRWAYNHSIYWRRWLNAKAIRGYQRPSGLAGNVPEGSKGPCSPHLQLDAPAQGGPGDGEERGREEAN